MPKQVGQLTVDLLLNSAAYLRGMSRVVAQTRVMARQIQQVGRNLSFAVSLPLAGAAAAAVKFSVDFQKSMNRVKALTDATSKEFQVLTETARTAGRTTVFTATESASAMEYLAQTGFKTHDILAALPGTLNLAAAGMLDLGNAADIASNVLKQFRLGTEQMNRVADVLAQTQANTNTNVVQLAEALQVAGPTAAAAGVSLEELAAAVGILGDNGIQGSFAGTALNRAILDLLATTPRAERTLQAFGVAIRDGKDQMLPLVDIIDELNTKIGARPGVLSSIFEVRALRAILPLLATGADRLREMREEGKRAAGTAERIAKIQFQGIVRAFQLMRNAIRDISIELTNAGLDRLFIGLAERANQMSRDFAAADEATKRWVVQLSLMAIIMPPIIALVGGLVLGVAALAAAFGTLAIEVSILTFGLSALAGLYAWKQIEQVMREGSHTIHGTAEEYQKFLDTLKKPPIVQKIRYEGPLDFTPQAVPFPTISVPGIDSRGIKAQLTGLPNLSTEELERIGPALQAMNAELDRLGERGRFGALDAIAIKAQVFGKEFNEAEARANELRTSLETMLEAGVIPGADGFEAFTQKTREYFQALKDARALQDAEDAANALQAFRLAVNQIRVETHQLTISDPIERQTQQVLQTLITDLVLGKVTGEKFAKAVQQAFEAVEDLGEGLRKSKLDQQITDYNDAMRKAAQDTAALEITDPIERQLASLRQSLVDTAILIEDGKIFDRLADIDKVIADRRTGLLNEKRLKELEKDSKKAAKLLEEPMLQAVRNIQTAWASAFKDIFKGGVTSFKDLGKSIVDIMIDAAAESAAALVFQPFLESVTGSGGLQGLLGNLGSLFGASSTGLSAAEISQLQSAGLGSRAGDLARIIGVSGSGSSTGTGFLGGLGRILGGIGGSLIAASPALGLLGLLDNQSSSVRGAAYGGLAGAALGVAAPSLISAAAGLGLIGSLTSLSAFGAGTFGGALALLSGGTVAAVSAGTGTAAGVGGGAVVGATFGSYLPIIGTIIGAALGAIIGIFAGPQGTSRTQATFFGIPAGADPADYGIQGTDQPRTAFGPGRFGGVLIPYTLPPDYATATGPLGQVVQTYEHRGPGGTQFLDAIIKFDTFVAGLLDQRQRDIVADAVSQAEQFGTNVTASRFSGASLKNIFQDRLIPGIEALAQDLANQVGLGVVDAEGSFQTLVVSQTKSVEDLAQKLSDYLDSIRGLSFGLRELSGETIPQSEQSLRQINDLFRRLAPLANTFGIELDVLDAKLAQGLEKLRRNAELASIRGLASLTDPFADVLFGFAEDTGSRLREAIGAGVGLDLVEALNLEGLRNVLTEFNAPIKNLLDSLKVSTEIFPRSEVLTRLFDQFEEIAIPGGNTSQIASVADSLLQVARDAYGSAPQFFDIYDQISSRLESLLIEVPDATSETNDLLAELLEEIATNNVRNYDDRETALDRLATIVSEIRGLRSEVSANAGAFV